MKGINQNFWTGDKLLGISAIIISLSTLVVFVYQTNLIRKQQYMSVYPHLNLSNYNSETLNYKYVLRNDGVGPAFVKAIQIIDPSGNEHESLVVYVEQTLPMQDSISVHHSSLYVGKLISANEEVILFGLSDKSYTEPNGFPDNTVAGAKILRSILNDDNFTLEIEYESIYGERWSITNHSDMPIKQ